MEWWLSCFWPLEGQGQDNDRLGAAVEVGHACALTNQKCHCLWLSSLAMLHSSLAAKNTHTDTPCPKLVLIGQPLPIWQVTPPSLFHPSLLSLLSLSIPYVTILDGSLASQNSHTDPTCPKLVLIGCQWHFPGIELLSMVETDLNDRNRFLNGDTTCKGSGAEIDLQHFLFYCNLYQENRNRYDLFSQNINRREEIKHYIQEFWNKRLKAVKRRQNNQP